MFIIEVPYFNLDQIYASGQAPRWIKLKDSKYVVTFQDKALKIEQQKDRLLMSCSEEDFYNVWFRYFDMETDYSNVNESIKRFNKKFKVPANRGRGIHILRQDTFETYVLCKLIQNVGWKLAGSVMNKIAYEYGIYHKQSMREAGRITWYEWPTPESLLEQLLKEEGKLDPIKSFLLRLSDAIVNHDYALIHNGNSIFNLLGKHDFTVFPEFEIDETIRKNFKCDFDTFCDKYIDGLDNAGMLYMYIMNHITNPPKEVSGCGVGR